jgi:hypothetical protein
MARPLILCCTAMALCTALALMPRPCDGRAEEPRAEESDLKELIAQLGNERFEIREAATRRLRAREDAIAALQEAVKSGDAEVARRAREILDWFARRQKERAFAAFVDATKQGAVDDAIERLARRAQWDDENLCWQTLADLGAKLAEIELQKFNKPTLNGVYMADDGWLRTAQRQLRFKSAAGTRTAIALWQKRLVLRAEEITEGQLVDHALFAIAGNVKLRHLTNSVLYANGSIDIDGYIGRSVIVCDGEVSGTGDISSSLIIARGKVNCNNSLVRRSHIISGAEVVARHPEWLEDSKLQAKQPKPLAFVTFFDPAKAGITVELAEGGVRVKAVEQNKPFAKSGLRADDLVSALDGDAVKDAETFRRVLRGKLAVDGTTLFKVRRGKETLDIPVAHRD